MPPEMVLVSPDDPKPLLSPEMQLVLGVRVEAMQIPNVVAQMEAKLQRRNACHFIAVTGMHGVMEVQHDAAFKVDLKSADLIVPGNRLNWQYDCWSENKKVTTP